MPSTNASRGAPAKHARDLLVLAGSHALTAAGTACLRRFETVYRSGMEARAGGAVHRLALEWSGVEPAPIGEVRPHAKPMCRWKLLPATHRRHGFGGNHKNVGAQKVGLTHRNLQASSTR